MPTTHRHLSDHDRHVLYGQGRVVVLPKSGKLKLTTVQDGYFLLTAGTVNLLLNDKTDIARINKGDWLATAMLVPRDGSFDLYLRAIEDSKLLFLSTASISALDTGTRTAIDQGIQRIAKHLKDCASHLNRLEQSMAEHVKQFIRSRAQARLAEYESSRFIQRAIANIDTLPTVADKLLRVISSDSTPLSEVTAYILSNPSLSTEVLKVVNSAYYGLRAKVSDINRAILYLGLNQIYQIVVSNSLLKVIGNCPYLLDVHNHSMIVSYLAGLLCTGCDKSNLAIATTIGILHDVGEIVKYTLKEKYGELDILIDHLSSPKLGSMLLHKWGIPDTVYRAIEMQDQTSYTLPDDFPAQLRGHLAYLHVAHDIYSFFSSGDRLPDPLASSYLSVLGFDDMTIDELIRLRIIPALRSKSHKLPVNVQVFFSV